MFYKSLSSDKNPSYSKNVLGRKVKYLKKKNKINPITRYKFKKWIVSIIMQHKSAPYTQQCSGESRRKKRALETFELVWLSQNANKQNSYKPLVNDIKKSKICPLYIPIWIITRFNIFDSYYTSFSFNIGQKCCETNIRDPFRK